MVKMIKSKPRAKKPDLVLLAAVLLTSGFGLLMVYNASIVEAFALFSDKYYFLKQQALWLAIGTVVLLLAAYVPLSLIKKLALLLLLATVVLLILVLIPGLGTQSLGARRWLSLGEFQLQPTELAKLSLVIYLAAWLENRRPLLHFLAILGVFLGLIMLQPDLGTALIVIFTAVIVYYASLQMMLDFKPHAHRQLPGAFGLFAAGGVIGAIAGVVVGSENGFILAAQDARDLGGQPTEAFTLGIDEIPLALDIVRFDIECFHHVPLGV